MGHREISAILYILYSTQFEAKIEKYEKADTTTTERPQLYTDPFRRVVQRQPKHVTTTSNVVFSLHSTRLAIQTSLLNYRALLGFHF